MWDVVDEGLAPDAPAPGLSDLAEADARADAAADDRGDAAGDDAGDDACGLLDARAVDVYRGCHAAVFLVDPRRPASLARGARAGIRSPRAPKRAR